jgi:hypothetical protein
MISPAEESFIRQRAYIPEHIPGYGRVLSGCEPFLVDDFLLYSGGETLVFIGYPLEEPPDPGRLEGVLDAAARRFHARRVILIAPALPAREGARGEPDAYWRLELTDLRVRGKVRNMIKRAGRELTVQRGRILDGRHRRLMADFIEAKALEENARFLYGSIPAYLDEVSTAEVLSAFDAAGNLVAFDIADFWPGRYAIYMFNFRSRTHIVPGASDLLLDALIGEARARGKEQVNLGLGINEGVALFKRKWGACPFLNHESLEFRIKGPSLLDLLKRGVRRK